MPKFKFHLKSVDQTHLCAWKITAESEDVAWEIMADVKQVPAEELKKFITIKTITDDTEHAS